MPSREKNISSLGAAVQYNFRRMLLVLSREENISSLGAVIQHNLAPKYTYMMPSQAPGGAMGPAEGAIASIAPAVLRACTLVTTGLIPFKFGMHLEIYKLQCSHQSRVRYLYLHVRTCTPRFCIS